MKELSGTLLPEFPFQNTYKVGDLVNYNGPLLSLFSNKKGELFLFHWVDSDKNYNRWVIVKITLTQLNQYLNKSISHYLLLTTCFDDYIVSADIDNDLQYHNTRLLNTSEIPQDYLPDKDVLHNDEEAPHLEKIKAFIIELKSKMAEERKARWQNKFKTGLPYEQLFQKAEQISNREQILIVA